MNRWSDRLGCAVVTGALLVSFGGCEALNALVDPTHGMTPEQKTAYYADQRAKQEAFAARNIQDVTTPGEGHSEAKDSALVGRWGNQREANWITSIPILGKREGKRRWAEDMTFFENGSYAYQLKEDKRWGKDDKDRDWELDMGAAFQNSTNVERGQWKVENGKLYLRKLAYSGYTGWALRGGYELRNDRRQVMIADEPGAEQAKQRLGENASLAEAAQAIAENLMVLNRR